MARRFPTKMNAESPKAMSNDLPLLGWTFSPALGQNVLNTQASECSRLCPENKKYLPKMLYIKHKPIKVANDARAQYGKCQLSDFEHNQLFQFT